MSLIEDIFSFIKTIQFIFALGILAVLFGCQKTHTCNCYALGNLTETHSLKGTLDKAEKACSAYEPDIPWSESWCTIED